MVMSEQNKNAGIQQVGITSKPASTDKKGTGPSTDQRDQTSTKTPSHEQGREHTPNVNAQNEAADARSTAEQSHVPTATSNVTQKDNNNAKDRMDNEAGDAKQAKAEGHGNRQTGHEPAKLPGVTDASGKS